VSTTVSALGKLGIDERVVTALAEQGITELYPPQVDAWAALKTGKNVVVSVPTASGKSLVAYLALLRNFLTTGRKGIYIVPLRALASEKFDELRQFTSLGLKVGIATGDLDEKDPRLGRFDVIVCTSEKADSMLRHRVGWVDDVGCVVADELHLIHDSRRGPTLEVLLSRFHALFPGTQIIGLSATISNAQTIARWLDADLVLSDWRPVDLRVGTYAEGSLRFVGLEPRDLPVGGDPVASLVTDAINAGGQCLVFVSTRRSAESQATKLAGIVRDLLPTESVAVLEEAVASLDDGGEGSITAKKLAKLCLAGVAYHTAGLDSKQRKFVEAQFRAGNLKVLCATPTLAAGVNTPARRVIIRDLNRFEAGKGNAPLPIMEVHQMMGRAGRPRYDPYGEAVLLCKSQDQADGITDEYLHGEPEPVTSKLAADAALRIHVLASIAGGYCKTEEELQSFLGSTFWAEESQDWIIRDRLDDVLWFLTDNEFIEEDGDIYRTTLFGKRTSDLYIDPFSALRIKSALESEIAPTDFGFLQVVSGCPDIYPLYLKKADDWVAIRLQQDAAKHLLPDDLDDSEDAQSYAKTAYLLADWVEETTLQSLEEKYGIGPGDIRMRIDTAGWLLHAFRELARALQPNLQKPLSQLGLRLSHGVKKELLPLLDLAGIGRIRARKLSNSGFKTLASIKTAPVDRLAALDGFGPKVAMNLLAQLGVDATATPEPAPQDSADEGSESPDPSGQMSLTSFKETP
jgi:helicase